MLSIGELSKRTGVKIPTIRYYEQQGLIDSPERSEGNQRRYEPAQLECLSFIKHARDLGIPIGSVKELIRLGSHPDGPCEDADRIANENLSAVRARIAKLKKLEAELERIASGCDSNKIHDCYVIRALADHSLCEHEH